MSIVTGGRSPATLLRRSRLVVLLLVTVLRGPVSPIRTLAAMTIGCGLSVGAYYAFPDAADKHWERVLPFVVSLAIAAWPSATRR